jgi:hypothetical protein
VDNKASRSLSRPRVARLQQQIEDLFQVCIIRSLILQRRMIFMRMPHNWLDYDVAALAFLILGIAAVEVLAIIL